MKNRILVLLILLLLVAAPCAQAKGRPGGFSGGFQMEESVERDYAENILPLPVDQRYDENDMNILVYEVFAVIRESCYF